MGHIDHQNESVKKMLQSSLKIKVPAQTLTKVSVLEQIEQHCSLTNHAMEHNSAFSKVANKHEHVLNECL